MEIMFNKGDILMHRKRNSLCVFSFDCISDAWSKSGGWESYICGKNIYSFEEEDFKKNIIFKPNEVTYATSDLVSKYNDVLREIGRKNDSCIKPLDFVMDKANTNIGIVTETNGVGGTCSVSWIIKKTCLHNAWWNQDELIKVNNLPNMIAKRFATPFSGNEDTVDDFYK